MKVTIMNQSPENTGLLEIDIEQWRRDVQTFVEMTKQELSSIHDQLASGFTSGPQNTRPREPASTGSATWRAPDTTAENQPAPDKTKTQEHLAQLKQKLADKIKASGR